VVVVEEEEEEEEEKKKKKKQISSNHTRECISCGGQPAGQGQGTQSMGCGGGTRKHMAKNNHHYHTDLELGGICRMVASISTTTTAAACAESCWEWEMLTMNGNIFIHDQV
jgi:hypothetical protein